MPAPMNGIIPRFLDEFIKYQKHQEPFFFSKGYNKSYHLNKNSLKEIILNKNFLTKAGEIIINFNIFSSKKLYNYTIKWGLDTRLGMTELSGEYLLPSQFKQHSFATNTFLDEDTNLSYTDSCAILVQNACTNPEYQRNRFNKIYIEYKKSRLSALMCYPPNYNLQDTSQCILFHNPNNITLAEYMVNNRRGVSLKTGIPQQAQAINKCPLIMYDYVNTGINQRLDYQKATVTSMLNDAEAVLNYALSNCEKVHIYSDGLGYKIAIISLQKYLQENNNIDISRLQLYNVNNVDVTSSKLLSNDSNWFVDIINFLSGSNLDAESAIKYLLDAGVEITKQTIHENQQDL